MIFATAGHVDHGKTSLLRALTGADTDRLPEEKRRGMTIDLGYAYLPLPDSDILGFIDVPGHEKFLTNMLAGVGGVQHALLVVACDDGVMPQTEEHLAILHLLRIPGLTVVLTKIDKVEAARCAEVRAALEQELRRYAWNSVAFFEVSATTGDGIAALKAHLQALALQQKTSPTLDARRFRLAIDRAFHVHGAGLVVTGTALGGRINIGDTLWLTSTGRSVRVRHLRAQDHPVEAAYAGQRIALNLVGDLHKDDIARGDWLLSEAPPMPVSRCLVDVNLLDAASPLQPWQSVHLHHAASHLTGRLSLLQEPETVTNHVLCELALDTPLHLADDDVLIVRDVSARHTLAGARVLSLTPPRRGKRQPTFLHWLARRAETNDDHDVLALWLQQGAVDLDAFAWARQLAAPALQALQLSSGALIKGGYAMDAAMADQQCDSLVTALAESHTRYPEHLGVGRARLRRMALPNTPEALVFAHIDRLLGEKRLINTNGWLHLPQHRLAFTSEEDVLWQRLLPFFREPPCWVRDLAHAARIPEETARALLHKAARLGYAVAVVRDRYYLTSQIAHIAQTVRAAAVGSDDDGMETAALRNRFGVGRKLAIQILEFFDRSGFTRRQGNRHLLRDAELFAVKDDKHGADGTHNSEIAVSSGLDPDI
ncbi:MAG: selenocysteine-specific translation elongation factor [Burkholderiales bacterium]|jgi:selenocysteine-specific elongation factor|nr:selenocysteine-specific translation elongation factor [Burkholderiales bacterium]